MGTQAEDMQVMPAAQAEPMQEDDDYLAALDTMLDTSAVDMLPPAASSAAAVRFRFPSASGPVASPSYTMI